MIKFKKGLDRHQELLMPQKIEEYIGENHLARLVCEICNKKLQQLNDFLILCFDSKM